MGDLLPCPFCGEDAELMPARLLADGADVPVFCNGCHASASDAAAWNRRPILHTEAEGMVEVLEKLLDYAERQTCAHENTYRGGFLWEICEDCGAKWADDEGGKPAYSDPSEIADAHAILARIRSAGA